MSESHSGAYDAWWSIAGTELIAALRRAHSGDAPEIVYAELFANSDSEDYRPQIVRDIEAARDALIAAPSFRRSPTSCRLCGIDTETPSD